MDADHVGMVGGRPGVVGRRRLEVLALVGEVDRQPRAGCRRALEHQLGQRLRHDLARRVVGRAEEHELRLVSIEEPREVAGHAVGVGHRPVGPRRRVEHRQPHDPRSRRHEGELAFVVGVGGIEQHHRVARVHQRAEQVVGELGAAEPDRDVLGAEARHAEEVGLEARDLLAAGQVAEGGGVGAALVERLGIADDVLVGAAERRPAPRGSPSRRRTR